MYTYEVNMSKITTCRNSVVAVCGQVLHRCYANYKHSVNILFGGKRQLRHMIIFETTAD